MRKIGFLACKETLPSKSDQPNTERRGDAFEHDLQMDAFMPAFAHENMQIIVLDWRAPLANFDGLDLILLGTAWDYQDHPDAFLARLEALQTAGITVCNPPEIVSWNMRKTYLNTLAEKGAAVIPTLWIDHPDTTSVQNAMDSFRTNSVVVKRQVGAGALGQHRFSRDDMPDADWVMGHPAMIQPFLPQISDEGEFSFIFIDGKFSHAVLKQATTGDYRIQSLYGGTETAIIPSDEDIAAAAAILDLLPFEAPLYARIDMVRALLADSAKKQLLLMEAEMIEPYLYPQQGSNLGPLLAKATAKRLT